MTDEERGWWQAYWRDPSPALETFLFSHYEPLVRMVRGRAFSGVDASYSMEAGDIDQEGSIGLLLAIRRFRPAMGRFETYANRYVWGVAMHGLKNADLTPKAVAAKGERWVTSPLYHEIEGEEAPADTLPAEEGDPVAVLAEREVETALTRALRRLTADHRAAFRLATFPGEVPGHAGTLTPAQIARRLRLPRREVRNLVTETQAVVRYLLGRRRVLLVRKTDEFSYGEKTMRKPGRPPGRKFPARFEYQPDELTRDIARKLAAFEGKSEAAIHRQAIREKYARLRREHPDDPRLSLGREPCLWERRMGSRGNPYLQLAMRLGPGFISSPRPPFSAMATPIPIRRGMDWQMLLLALLALAFVVVAISLAEGQWQETKARRVADQQQATSLRMLETKVRALDERWLLDQYLREAPLAGREGRK